MKIPNYDSNTKNESNQYELSNFFGEISRTLLVGPSGGGKTNLLFFILTEPLIYYDEIVIYTKTPEQDKYQSLEKIYKKVMKDGGIKHPFWSIRSGDVEPVDNLDKIKRKLIIFDDYILEKKQFPTIVKYFVLGRHHKCSVIFLSQSYYNVPKEIRLNCSHFCIFFLGTRREIRSVLTDHTGIDEETYRKNTQGFDFICINKIKKLLLKNLDEEIEK